MKTTLMFFVLFTRISVVYAEPVFMSDEEYMSKHNNDIITKDRDETKTNLDYAVVSYNWKARELNKIETDMQQLNPDLVEKLKNKPLEIRAAEYKSWLAQKTFEDFYNRYMQDLQNYSEKLGRQIKERDVTKDGRVVEYSLSTDDLTDCHTAQDGEKWCYKPDGYIMYEITYTNTDKNKSLTVSKDVPEENRSSYYQFSLTYKGNHEFETLNGDTRNENYYMFGFTGVDFPYNKELAYRNYLVKDMLNGMCQIICKNCYGEGITRIKCDTESDKYKTNMGSYVVRGVNFIENYSYTRSE